MSSGPMSSTMSVRDLSVNGDEEDRDQPMDDDQPAKKKRRRQKNSCLPCQRRKTKCDKEDPCSACTKRNEGDQCTWDLPPLVGPVPHDIAAEFGALKRRLSSLERIISLRPDVSMKVSDSPTTSTSVALPPTSMSYMPTFDTSPTTSPTFSLPPLQPASHSSQPASRTTAGSLLFELPTPPPDSQKIDAEAEEAVQALEDLALGRRQFLSLGRSSELPRVGKMVLNETDERESPSPSVPMSGAFTTILLNTRAASRSVFVTRSRQESHLLECLPERVVSDALVNEFFTEIGWVYQVLHRPTFEAECRELWDCVATGTDSRIDPAWLSIYWMVLTWSVSTLGRAKSREVLCHYPESEVQKLPEIWYEAADKALYACDWAGRPQVRAVQAMLLKLSYQRTTPQEVDVGHEASSFFVWLGTATRICQLLGLHKLGSDPNLMPRDDPAWPRQACCLKRELAKRIWSFVVSFEWLYCSGRGIGQLLPHHFDTDMPLNVDDEDLGLHLLVKERPAEYLTDLSFARAKFAVARHQIHAKMISDQNPNPDYSTILELDAQLQTEIQAIERTREGSNPRRKPYHRALCLALVHNRVLRLHRPFFMRGWREATFQPSSSKALQSASEICIGLSQMTIDDGNLEHLWFCWAYGIGAIMVLFLNILREEQAGGPQDVTGDKRDLMLGVRGFFVRGIQQGDTTSGVLQMSLQAVRIVDHLLLPRQASGNSALPKLPVATIFREITKQVNSPTAADGSPIVGDSPLSPRPYVTDTPSNGLASGHLSANDVMSSTLFNGHSMSSSNGMADFFSTYDLSVPGSSLDEPFGVIASRAAMFDFQQALPSVDNWESLFSQVADPNGY